MTNYVTNIVLQRRFCTAPMMSYSHKHARYLWRLLCPPAMIYTEMMMAEALLRGKSRHLLDTPPIQAPVGLQLGGNVAKKMAQAAMIAEDAGYSEININCGCPSPKVKKGGFGACLMRQPLLVADLVTEMKAAVDLPISVKCRIAVDGMNADLDLDRFVEHVSQAGCDILIVHARRAWLNGLNPSQNRSIPPLDYDRVARLKKTFPNLNIILNGGINNVESIKSILKWCDGAMIGRAISNCPLLLSEIATGIFAYPRVNKWEILDQMQSYVSSLAEHEKRWALSSLSGIYRGEKNSKLYRQALQAGKIIIPKYAA